MVPPPALRHTAEGRDKIRMSTLGVGSVATRGCIVAVLLAVWHTDSDFRERSECIVLCRVYLDRLVWVLRETESRGGRAGPGQS